MEPGTQSLPSPSRTPTARAFDVFLSHNSRDKSVVELIAAHLQEAGLSPWLDRWTLTAGADWQAELGHGIDASRACAVFIGPQDLGAWELQEVALALDRAAKDASFRVFAVLLPGLAEPFEPTVLPPFLRTRTWVDFRGGPEDRDALKDLVAAVEGLPFGPAAPAEPRGDLVPYRGLQTFDEDDAPLFFGREREVQRLVEMLRRTRMLAVVGASGSGKSSLVLAGLVPALRAGALRGADTWTVCVIRPGSAPLEALASRLEALDGGRGMQATLEALGTDPRTLHLAGTLALASQPAGHRILWVVDQLEEAFTLTHDPAQRAAFFDNLLFAAAAPGGPSTVVLTVRADFYAHVATHAELAQQVAAHQFLVGAMDRDSLRSVIEAPARLAGVEPEPGLVDTILEDVGDEPGALPLLEHALLELWERRRGHVLSLEGYRASGGVRGALAARAEAIYEGFDAPRRVLAKRILLRLTQPGEGTEDTRRRASMTELAGTQVGAVEGVVAELAQARMLTVGGDAERDRWVDVSHEALIRGWDRLREWVEEDRAGLLVHRRVTEAAQEWQRLERDESALQGGALLAEAVAWRTEHEDELNDLEREFVDASVERQDRQRRQASRRRRIVVGGLIAGLLVIGAFALVARQEAGTAARQRDAALSREIAASSTAQLGLDPELSVLLARAANEKARTPEAADALRHALAQARLRGVLTGHTAAVGSARFDARGDLVATASHDGTAGIYDARSGRRLHRLRHTANADVLSGWVEDARFGPDRRWLVTTADGSARVWDTRSGRLLRKLVADDYTSTFTDGTLVLLLQNGVAKVRRAADGRLVSRLSDAVADGGDLWGAVEFSPDGRWVAAQVENRPPRLWDVRTGRLVRSLGPRAQSAVRFADGGFAFSRDSRLLLRSGAGPESLWRLPDARLVGRYPGAGEAGDAAIAPDGRRLVLVEGSTATVRDAVSGDLVSELHHPDDVLSAAFNPDSTELVTASADGVARIWEASTGREIAELRGHSGRVLDARFSPDGASVATASFDGTARLWRTRLGREPAPMTEGGSVNAIAFSPDGRRLLTGSGGGDVVVKDLRSGRSHVEALGDEVFDVEFRAGGRLVLAEGVGVAALWDAATGRLVRRFHGENLDDVAVSPDGRLAVTVADGRAEAMDLRGGARLGHIAAPTDELEQPSVDFSPDGREILTTTGTATVVWDARTGRRIASRRLAGVGKAVFSPDGERVASISFDAVSELWSARDGHLIAALREGGEELSEIAFSPDGDRLVGTTGDGPAQIWDAHTGRHLQDLRHVVAGDSEVTFSADGQWIATVSESGGRVWQATTGEPLLDVVHRLHDSPGRDAIVVDSVAVSPDGRWVATGGRDGTVQLHACETCAPVDALLRLADGRVTRVLSAAERRRYLRE